MAAKLIDIFEREQIEAWRSSSALSLHTLFELKALKNLTWEELSHLGLELMRLNNKKQVPGGLSAIYAMSDLVCRCQEKGLSIF